MSYLHNSKEIKNKLTKLFSVEGEKWAIVGFVGYNALDHLPPNISDLSVVCWPKAGGTNPDGIRRLIANGINVFFCDRLHHKVYWTKNTGLVIGSANLSDNALGDSGLHEFAVYCDDNTFDINKILKELNYKEVTYEALATLDIEHTAHYRSHNLSSDNTLHAELIKFTQAYGISYPKKWKIVCWSEHRLNNDLIQAEVENQFHTKEWTNDNDVESQSFQPGDLVLQIKIDNNGDIERANGCWLIVDHVIEQSKGEGVIVQIKPTDKSLIPFDVDSDFKKHFKKVFNLKNDWKDICDGDGFVLDSFIQEIKNCY